MLETIEELDVPDVEKDKLVPGRESDANNLNKGTDDKKEDKKEPLLKSDEKKGDAALKQAVAKGYVDWKDIKVIGD